MQVLRNCSGGLFGTVLNGPKIFRSNIPTSVYFHVNYRNDKLFRLDANQFSTIVRKPTRPKEKLTEKEIKKELRKEITKEKEEAKQSKLFPPIDRAMLNKIDQLDMSSFSKEQLEEMMYQLKEDFDDEMERINRGDYFQEEDFVYENEKGEIEEDDEGEIFEEIEFEIKESKEENDIQPVKIINAKKFSTPNSSPSDFLAKIKKQREESEIDRDTEDLEPPKEEIGKHDVDVEDYYSEENRINFNEATIDAVDLMFNNDDLLHLQNQVKNAKGISELMSINTYFSPDQFVEILENQHAEDIVVLDLRKKSNWFDYLVLCTAYSERHRRAIAEILRLQIRKRSQEVYKYVDPALEKFLKDDEEAFISKKEDSNWIVVDSDKINVYIFDPDTRKEYDIEGFWGNEVQELPQSEEDIIREFEEQERPHKDHQILRKRAERRDRANELRQKHNLKSEDN